MNQKITLLCIILSLLLIGAQSSNETIGYRAAISDMSNMKPDVNSPSDIIYFFGGTGNTITWEIADDDPSYYLIFKDDILVDAPSWDENNKTVVIDVDGFNPGVYEYEIIASDSYYNTSDVVLVTVLYNDLTPHTPFSVSNDAQLASLALSESWMGNGTESNPYIIERYIFDITTSGIGIHSTTSYFIIRNCTFASVGVDYSIGIDLQRIVHGKIMNCTFTNLWVGVIVWSSENISWESNLFSSLSYGIMLQESIDCRVVSNTFYTGGLSLAGFQLENWVHDVNNNQVNGKPLGYFNGLSGAHIDGNEYGQVLLINSTNSLIDGGIFDSVGNAVQIGHAMGCTVEYTVASHCSSAIFAERSNNTYILACVVEYCTDLGIHVNESANCVVMYCNVSSVEYSGIVALMSYNISLFYNVVTDCGDLAIALYESEYSSLCNNIVKDNRGTGIGLGDSSNSFIRDNSVKYNSDKGIYILWGDHYLIYRNEIGFNSGGNAYDEGVNNAWDDGISTGNKWSDYEGSGYYYINGTAGSVDHFPGILEINEIPTINHPSDITYTNGTTGHYITWSASSFHPAFYLVNKDGEVFALHPWSGSSITLNVDGLNIGSYTFTIYVVDIFGQNATDTVIVNVIMDNVVTTTTTTTTTNNTTNDFLLQQITLIVSLGSVGVIIIVIILIARGKTGASY